MIIETISLLANAAGLHGWFTGLRTGQVQDEMLARITAAQIISERNEATLERLSDHIF